MMCFRDRSFCPLDKCHVFESCPRALTDTVKWEAVRWWVAGGGKAEDTPIKSMAQSQNVFSTDESPEA